jgi:dihydrodipicolinate synthase/N-acetylneuraminate lyase/catechol-2,3-dioxygenase
MINVCRISHATLASPDISPQLDHYTRIMGLSVAAREQGRVVLATREGVEVLVLEEGARSQLSALAFQVSPGLDLEALRRSLGAAGVDARLASGLTPGVSEAVCFTDPDGTRIELFADYRFTPSADVVAGISPLRLGHVARFVPNYDEVRAFYLETLGFRVSDERTDVGAFLRCGPDHHTINIFRNQQRSLAHIAFEVKDAGEINRSCDILARNGSKLDWGPSRHNIGHNVACYHVDPGGVRVEIYTEMDQMKSEELGYFDPRPWHTDLQELLGRMGRVIATEPIAAAPLPRPIGLSMHATPFSLDGALDLAALRGSLDRLIDAGLGVILGSGGNGEGHTLTPDELRAVYRTGVAAYGGGMPVHANPPEQHTAAATVQHARLACEAGVDVVHIYGPAGWHGMRPTELELRRFFDAVIPAIDRPVAIGVASIIGYTLDPALVVQLCRDFPAITTIRLPPYADDYLLRLKGQLPPTTSFLVPVAGSPGALGLGAAGIYGSEANIIPKTMRRYLDGIAANDLTSATATYDELRRFATYVAQWEPSSVRWVKMAMRVLGLPGGAGGLREPYSLPDATELQRFADGLARLGLPEIDALLSAPRLR